MRLLKDPLSLALNISGDGASINSLGDLFYCLTTHGKTLSFLHLIWIFFLLVYPLPYPIFLIKAAIRSRFLVLFASLSHLHGPSLDLLQWELRAQELSEAIYVGFHQSEIVPVKKVCMLPAFWITCKKWKLAEKHFGYVD